MFDFVATGDLVKGIFRLDAFRPQHLDHVQDMETPSPVIAVSTITDLRLVLAYRNRLEIRNVQLELLRHFDCNGFEVLDAAVTSEKLLVILVQAQTSDLYEVRMVNAELKGMKTAFKADIDQPRDSLLKPQPHIYCSNKRIIITEPFTTKLYIFNFKGQALDRVDLLISPYTLAIIDKYTMLTNNRLWTYKVAICPFGYLTVEICQPQKLRYDLFAGQKSGGLLPSNTFGTSCSNSKSATAFHQVARFTKQPSGHSLLPSAKEFEGLQLLALPKSKNSLSTTEQQSHNPLPNKDFSDFPLPSKSSTMSSESLSDQHDPFHPIRCTFSKAKDEFGFYYLAQHQGFGEKEEVVISVFSNTGNS